MKLWLRRILGVESFDQFDARLLDLERQFVTKRDGETGKVLETLADVPLQERERRRNALRGLSWQQKQKWLERTDGGRLPEPQRTPTSQTYSQKAGK